MFGRVPRLPIDLILPTYSSTTPSQSKSSYVENWRDQMKEAYQLAFQYSDERKTKDVVRRNAKRPCLTTLEPGDRVLIRNLSERGRTGKMRSYWEEQIYIIVCSIGNDPAVYKIRPEHDPKGKIRIAHRNMLMHCDNLLDNFAWNIREPVYQKYPVQARADRKIRKTSKKIQNQSQEPQSTSSDSDKEDINFSPNQLRFLEEVVSEKKNKPNSRKDNQSNLNENKLEDNCAKDMKTFKRNSSPIDMKESQGISSAIDTEAFRRISSTADEKAESGKIDKVEKGAYYGTREECLTDKKNEEGEAVDFKIEYDTRHKSKKTQGASNRIMKVIQIEDEPLIHCRIKKVIELEEEVPNLTTLITEEHQSQDVKQKQPLKSYPLRHRKADAKAINCKQGASNNISAQIRRSNHQQGIRKSRIPIPTWRKKLRSSFQPKKLPAKPVRHFSKVTSHRTDK